MTVTVYDQRGREFVVDNNFSHETIGLPLVTELRTKHSFPFGDAETVQTAFSGIYIVYGDMVMKESNRLHIETFGHHDLVELHFTLAGIGNVHNKASGNKYLFKENETNLHYTPDFSGVANYSDKEHFKFFEVHFTTAFFFELAKDSSPVLMQFAETIAANSNGELSKHNIPISFGMHQCIQDIMNCRYTGGLKLLFLQSKCIELLAMQAQAYEDAAQRPGTLVCKSDYDIDCIRYAKEYLLQRAAKPPSLGELAKVAGINEFKLKHGFKEVFSHTVFGYLNDYRLTQARELLLAKKTPIKQVADELGYSSVQHFSNAFRKKFGVPPGKTV